VRRVTRAPFVDLAVAVVVEPVAVRAVRELRVDLRVSIALVLGRRGALARVRPRHVAARVGHAHRGDLGPGVVDEAGAVDDLRVRVGLATRVRSGGDDDAPSRARPGGAEGAAGAGAGAAHRAGRISRAARARFAVASFFREHAARIAAAVISQKGALQDRGRIVGVQSPEPPQ
jgi:hypothetical protein